MAELNESSQAIGTGGGVLRALRSPNYRLYFTGQGVSLIGTWMQNVALSWLVYRLTKSSFLLGVVGFISQIPMMLLTPVTGVLADRWNRFKIMVIVQTVLMILALVLALLVFTHWISIWHIIVLGLIIGAANALDAPTRHSFVVDLVERREDLSNAIALNSVMFNSARLIGPSIAGLIIAWIGEGSCFLLNAASFLAVIWALLDMKIPKQQAAANPNASILTELKEGFLYTFGAKPIRYMVLHFAFVALVGMSFTVLLPVLATEVLHGGPSSLGFLLGAMGIGALIGSLMMAARKGIEGLWKIAAVSSTVFGLGLMLLSTSRHLLLSLLIMVLTGMGMITIMTASNIFMQASTEDGKRARVMSFYLLAFFGTVPSGNLLTGSLAHMIGVQHTILLGGILSLIGSFVFYFKFSRLNNSKK